MSGSRLAISSVRHATPRQWDDTWANCDYATYFHSRAWAEIWQAYTRGKLRPVPRIVAFSDGTEAVLPFTAQRILIGLTTRWLSSPAGTYGGWIATNSLSAQHVELLTHHILGGSPNLTWRLNPYCSAPETISGARSDFTHRLALSTVNGDATRLQSKGHRSAVSKAMRAGVTVDRADGKADWDAYYDVYLDSLARWGDQATSHYDQRLFAIIREHAEEVGHIDLWLARDGKRVIAGALCLCSKHIVVYWHGASLKSYFSARPANLLLTRIIEDYARNGFTWFDFNPSGGHKGVAEFKRHLGAEPVASDVVVNRPAAIHYLSQLIGIRQAER